MITQKLNESFYKVSGTHQELEPVMKQLQVEREGARFDPMVKRGLKPSWDAFYNVVEGGLIIPSGLIPFLGKFGIQPAPRIQDFTRQDIDDYLKTVNLPFELYPHQINAIYDSILNQQQMCISATGSGKSAIISLVVDFFRTKGLKGLILVPSVSLTTQIHTDFLDYNLQELYDCTHLIGGDNHDKNLDSPVTVSTWQSMMLMKEHLKSVDFIIIDEGHGLKGETQSADIVYKCINAKYRIGLSGTLPESNSDKLSIFSCVGAPVVYIRTQGLIELGLATPVNINVLKLEYHDGDKTLFRHVGNYAKQLQFIKEHENRNLFISRLATGTSKIGSTVVMCSHVEHGKDIFRTIMKENFQIDVDNKDIVGKKAFEFQNKYGVYFIMGATEQKQRIQIIDILKNHGPDFIKLEFGDVLIKVHKNDIIPLSNGLFKKASEITKDDDVDDEWIGLSLTPVENI